MCSALAGDLHVILRQLIDSAAGCMSLGVQTESESVSGSTGRLVLSTEVTSARVLQTAASAQEVSVSQVPSNLTVVGSLQLEAVVVLGADIGNSSATNGSSLQATAVSCLESISAAELEGGWAQGAGNNASVDLQSSENGILEVVAMGPVAAGAAQCPELSAAVLAADATMAVIEDSLMQQLMLAQMVRPMPRCTVAACICPLS